MSRDDAWILQIVQAGERALAYVRSIEKAEFEANGMLHDAVMLQLIVLGEAAGKLSEEFRADHPEIPWRLIRATRNVVAHAYAAVDLDRIWIAVTQGLPEILAVLRPLIPADDSPSSDP